MSIIFCLLTLVICRQNTGRRENITDVECRSHFEVDFAMHDFNLTAEGNYLAECLPQIVKYMKSDKFIKWPYNGDMAFFGSRLQKPPS